MAPGRDWSNPAQLKKLIAETTTVLKKVDRVTDTARKTIAEMSAMALNVALVREEAKQRLDELLNREPSDFEVVQATRMRMEGKNPEVSKR